MAHLRRSPGGRHRVLWLRPDATGSTSRTFTTVEEAEAFLAFATAVEDLGRARRRLARAEAALAAALTALSQEDHP